MNKETEIAHKPTISPYQSKRVVSGVINVQGKFHPVRNEIKRLGVKQDFSAEWKEDVVALQTLSTLIPGVVAIVCEISQGGHVIARGHSISTFSVLNKYLTRTVSNAIQGSFTSACYAASKVFESLLSPNTELQEEEKSEEKYQNEKYQNQKYSAVVGAQDTPKTVTRAVVTKSDTFGASDKQRALLVDLVNQKVTAKDERERWYTEIESCNSRLDASEMISSFLMSASK